VALAVFSLTVGGAGIASPASGAVVAPPAVATAPAAVPFSMPAHAIVAGTVARRAVGVMSIAAGHADIRQATVTTLWTKQRTVAAGGAVTLVGTTVFGDGRTRVRAEVLRLQVRRTGGWATIGSRTLSSNGYVSYTVRPTRTATYRLVYTGAGTLAASASPATRITVSPATIAAKTVAAKPATASATTSTASVPSGSSTAVATILATAAAQLGKPYRYGGAGPSSFDCSGLTQYVYKRVGISLPHKANFQKGYGRAVSRADARPGDLVVFLDGGYGYHVGIYAGGGYMYDAPHSGTVVSKRTIWGTNVIFRRLV
jgi:cell wall-associated NlpC family hydrolase